MLHHSTTGTFLSCSVCKQRACGHTIALRSGTNVRSRRLQILGQLQAIAAQNELRFEVNRSTALVFQVRCLAGSAVPSSTRSSGSV